MKIASTFAVLSLLASSILGATKVSTDANNNLIIDGKTTFPISLAVLPPVDGKTPSGKSAWQEFSEAGVNLARVAPTDYWEALQEQFLKHGWNEAGLQVATKYFDQLAAVKMYGWMTLGEELPFVKPDDEHAQEQLRKFIERYKDHPALGGWKGADEPAWGNMNTHGKRPPSSIAVSYKIVHELDPNHPVIVMQAPRGTAEDNAAYDPYLDITGMDVFPISYPPGTHVPTWPNKEISMVGDWTKIIVEAAHGKPVWMTLQIAFSGTSKPGNTQRFPTFFEERFMTYEAIIDGARGINYFGGGIRLGRLERDKKLENDVAKNVAPTPRLNERDTKLGYNWTFWERVLKPLLAEINEASPIHEALLAGNSKLPVQVEEKGVEFVVREVGSDIYILACKREGETMQVKFSGLSTNVSTGNVLYEEPRTVTAKDGAFTDWFAPFDVHVYRFKR